MQARFDSFNRFETPMLLLCSPGAKIDSSGAVTNAIGFLNYTSDEEIVANFNELSEFNLAVYKVDDDEEQNKLYDSVKNRQYIYIEDIGFFCINSVEEHIDPRQTYKDVKLASCETELENRTIPGEFYLHEPISTDDDSVTYQFQELLEMLVSHLPLWTIGTVDSSLLNLYRTFEDVSEDTNILSFMLQDMQDAYECIFVFDILHRSVNVYAQNNYVHKSSIIISNDDVVKSIQISSSSDDIYTALSVTGDNGTGISAVNPTGSNSIFKFDYYLSEMPAALRAKVAAWQNAVADAEDAYYTLSQNYGEAYGEKSAADQEVDKFAYQLEKYKQCRQNIVGSSKLPANEAAGYAVSDDDWFQVSSVITKAKDESGIDITVTKLYSESRSISNNATTISYVPKGSSGSQIVALYVKDDDGIYIQKLTQTTATNIPVDCFRVNASAKTITFHTGQFTDATQVAVFYHPNSDTVEETSVIITDLLGVIDAKIMELESDWATARAAAAAAATRVNNLKAQMDSYHDTLAIENYFTQSEFETLSLYIFEGSYTDEYITITDSMSYSDQITQIKDLYDRSNGQLNKISVPTEQFSVDVENFIFHEKFAHWTDELETGVLIAVEIHPDDIADLFLTNFTVNYEDATLTMTFGNRYNKYDQKSLFEDLLGKVKRSANTVNFIKDQIYPITSGELDDMKLALDNMRTLSFGDALAAQNQSFIIDSTGITGTQTDDDGTVHPEQIKIVNNMIVMTDDSWQSCKLALGKIMTPGGVQRYGLNTEVLMGELILGSQLIMKNNSGGLTFNDNGLNITNNINTFNVNPNNSTKLLSLTQGNTDLFWVDAAGYLHISGGAIIGGSGERSFDDTVQALEDEIKQQADSVISTWAQGSDPSVNWNTTELKDIHDGDYWYYTGGTELTTSKDSENNNIKPSTTYQYTKISNTYKWVKTNNVATSLFDFADGKVDMYTGSHTDNPPFGVSNPNVNDLAVDTNDKKLYRCTSKSPNISWIEVDNYDAAVSSVKSSAKNTSIPVYYRAENATVPSKPTSSTTIYSSDNTSGQWTYKIPKPKSYLNGDEKHGCRYYTCTRYTDLNGDVSYSDVTEMSSLSASALWCSTNDQTLIDGADIYANSVTANQLAANSVTAAKISVTDLQAIGATIGGFTIDSTSIRSGEKTGTSDGDITLSTTNFTRNINSTPRSGLRFAIGSKFGIKNDGTVYASNAIIDGTITSSSATITGGSINIDTGEQTGTIILNHAYSSTNKIHNEYSPYRIYIYNDKNGTVVKDAIYSINGIYLSDDSTSTSQDLTISVDSITSETASIYMKSCQFQSGIFRNSLQVNGTGTFLSTTSFSGKISASDIDITGTLSIKPTISTEQTLQLAVTTDKAGLFDNTNNHWIIYGNTDSEIHVTRPFYLSQNTTLSNNTYLQAYPTIGAAYHLIGLTSSNHVAIGDSSLKYNMYFYGPTDRIDFETDSNNHVFFRPNSNGTLYLGSPSYQWYGVYAKNSFSLNGSAITSDRTKKKDIVDISDKYEQLFDKLKPKAFMHVDGDRIHIGAISQEVEQSMNEVGLTALEFGGFCKDVVYECEYDDEGHEIDGTLQIAKDENGEQLYDYALRYSEFIMLNTWQIQKLKARVAELEARLGLTEEENG